MDYALTLKDLFFILLGVGVLVLIFYVILFFKNLITGIKSLNVVMKDVEEITSVAASRTKDVDKVITNVTDTVETLTENIRENKSTVGFIGKTISFLTSLKGFISKKSTKADKSEDKE